MQKNIYPGTFPSWLFLLNSSAPGDIHILNYVTKMENIGLGPQYTEEKGFKLASFKSQNIYFRNKQPSL